MPLNILIRFYYPVNIGLEEDVLDEEIKKECFRINRYATEKEALDTYSNTRCDWSTLLDDSCDIEEFIDEVYSHIKNHDEKWLEENFT